LGFGDILAFFTGGSFSPEDEEIDGMLIEFAESDRVFTFGDKELAFADLDPVLVGRDPVLLVPVGLSLKRPELLDP